ncbi:MAG: lipocalin-like domain-containing protein [Thermodesulfobacteriota bacterium]|nr:lipocalin-like domain-containing protein [Thermodesulfobacteriota bacterium]
MKTLKHILLAFFFIAAANGSGLAEYRKALPGYKFTFPRDHYSHPDFAIEWWYYTGHLFTKKERRFGYELTFFRRGVSAAPQRKYSKWEVRDVFFAHLAITDVSKKKFRYFETMHRGHEGVAYASTESFEIKNGKWRLWGSPDKHRIKAEKSGYGIDLTLKPVWGPVVHGQDGISRKGEGQGHASHYYSFTRLKTSGTITINDQDYMAMGNSWMDHEFSSDQLGADQVGWDWFSLQLENNQEIMLYLMRKKDGTIDPYSSGTLVTRGNYEYLDISKFSVIPKGKWKSRKSGGIYPSGWDINLPEKNIRLKVVPLVKDQELITNESVRVTYWEGACKVSGKIGEDKVKGSAYVELTGYAGSLTDF